MYTFDVHVDDHVVLTSIAYACDSQLDPCLNSTIDQNRGLPVLVAITFANHFFNNSIDCACDWPSDPYLNSNDFIDVIADEATSDIVVIAGQLCLKVSQGCHLEPM